jgi:hypothetical protein
MPPTKVNQRHIKMAVLLSVTPVLSRLEGLVAGYLGVIAYQVLESLGIEYRD